MSDTMEVQPTGAAPVDTAPAEGLAAAAEETTPPPAPKFVDSDDDEGEGNKVPQWRVNEIARERREAREELARARAEIEELRKYAPKEEPKELDPKDFGSLKEWTAAVQKQEREKLLTEVEAREAQRESAREIERRNSELTSSFLAKFETAKAENPAVLQARDHVDRLINTGKLNIHPLVAREIMDHEDAPHLVYEIATNPKLLETLRSGDQIASLRAIHRFQHSGGSRAPSESLTMQGTTPPAAPRRPGAPERLPASAGSGGYPSSFSDFKAKRLAEMRGK